MVDFDRSIADLAMLALAAMEQRLAVNPADEMAIGRIITTVFGPIDTRGRWAREAEALVGDPQELHRIVQAVSEIVGAETKIAAR